MTGLCESIAQIRCSLPLQYFTPITTDLPPGHDKRKKKLQRNSVALNHSEDSFEPTTVISELISTQGREKEDCTYCTLTWNHRPIYRSKCAGDVSEHRVSESWSRSIGDRSSQISESEAGPDINRPPRTGVGSLKSRWLANGRKIDWVSTMFHTVGQPWPTPFHLL